MLDIGGGRLQSTSLWELRLDADSASDWELGDSPLTLDETDERLLSVDHRLALLLDCVDSDDGDDTDDDDMDDDELHS